MLSGVSVKTSAAGTVSLIFLPDGGSVVRLRRAGFEMATMAVRISPRDTLPVIVSMHRVAVPPATVTARDSAARYASPQVREAEERMKSHTGGQFIDEKTMHRWDGSTLTNLLRSSMPGMLAVSDNRGTTRFVSSRTPCRQRGCASPDCFVSVFLDSVPFPVNDFNRISPAEFALAEFYPGGSVPIQYGGTGAGCGVLLLWSRES